MTGDPKERPGTTEILAALKDVPLVSYYDAVVQAYKKVKEEGTPVSDDLEKLYQEVTA